jgi:hypothetical protein
LIDLGLLDELGFGSDAVLMNDPKLFLDVRFLAALIKQFEGELGTEVAGRALFQIGLMHGLREAQQAVEADPLEADGYAESGPPCRGTPLVIRLGSLQSQEPAGGLRLGGSWPEAHEARARLEGDERPAAPSCFLSAGFTSGWLSGTLDREILVVEHACSASGKAHCRFEAREISSWESDATTRTFLEALPRSGVVGFRKALALAHFSRSHDAASSGPDEAPGPEDRAVHIWGPVMVLPFVEANEALATIQMLSADPTTCSVRAVVVDLGGAVIDDGLAAAALERILHDIESWGADVILAGVTPLSEAVVDDLDGQFVITRKELPDAIASAFQIAEAQRHQV